MPEPETGRNAEKEGNARDGVPEKGTGYRKKGRGTGKRDGIREGAGAGKGQGFGNVRKLLYI